MGLAASQQMTTNKSIQLRDQKGVLFVTFNRPEAKNSINSVLVSEIREVLTQAETDPSIKVVVLEGNATHFCTGMDFQAVSNGTEDLMADDPDGYYEMLKQIGGGSKVIVSKVDGQVNAGGVGLVAASDLVIASEKATFGLSEMLFGLLPACVMPFLIRRVGVQKAQWMTLITQGIPAQRAYEIGLVDEVNGNTADSLRRNLLRLTRLETDTIRNLKAYMSELWIMNEQTQRLAVDKIASLINSEQVQHNIKNFVTTGAFPWSK